MELLKEISIVLNEGISDFDFAEEFQEEREEDFRAIFSKITDGYNSVVNNITKEIVNDFGITEEQANAVIDLVLEVMEERNR